MRTIDAQWIRDHLPPERGAKAELAAAMGVRPEAVTRILAGTRGIKATEIPRILAYFGLDSEAGIMGRAELASDLSPAMQRLMVQLAQLEDAELDFGSCRRRACRSAERGESLSITAILLSASAKA